MVGGNGILSVCWVTGVDIGNDRGKSMLTGSGVSSIGTGGLYCSIDVSRSDHCVRSSRGSRGSAISDEIAKVDFKEGSFPKGKSVM